MVTAPPYHHHYPSQVTCTRPVRCTVGLRVSLRSPDSHFQYAPTRAWGRWTQSFTRANDVFYHNSSSLINPMFYAYLWGVDTHACGRIHAYLKAHMQLRSSLFIKRITINMIYHSIYALHVHFCLVSLT